MIHAQGLDPYALYDEGFDWGGLEPALGAWITRAARALAHAIVSTLAVIDFDAIIIDGALPQDVCARLLAGVEDELSRLDLQGIRRPHLCAGHFGSSARALGAAAFCISTEFMLDRTIHTLEQAV